MSDNDHIDAQWLRAAQSPPLPPRRRGHGCALSLLVLILVLAGVLFYPRVQALLTPVPAVQIQMESSVLPDTAPNCAANPRVAAVRYPGLTSDPDYQRASSTLRCGFGPWVDVSLAGGEKPGWLRLDVTDADAPAWVCRLEELLAER